uniref:Uncharacterized protein n=1 Tax=Anopheles atroparvus TaxID=41427 RepID=A0A182ILK8_ANOAO
MSETIFVAHIRHVRVPLGAQIVAGCITVVTWHGHLQQRHLVLLVARAEAGAGLARRGRTVRAENLRASFDSLRVKDFFRLRGSASADAAPNSSLPCSSPLSDMVLRCSCSSGLRLGKCSSLTVTLSPDSVK